MNLAAGGYLGRLVAKGWAQRVTGQRAADYQMDLGYAITSDGEAAIMAALKE
jgi:hypothetical protein